MNELLLVNESNDCPIYCSKKQCLIHQKFYKYDGEITEIRLLNYFEKVILSINSLYIWFY